MDIPAPHNLAGEEPRKAWLPALAWLRDYRREWLRPDIVAGITLAAYLVPAGIGDASLANLPPEAGLYACLFSGMVFWLFCSSRHTAITVTSAISLLTGATLAGMANGDPSRFASLAACTAILVAIIALISWIVRAGAIVNFISEPVMVGFKAGVALFLASTQLPKLCGLKGSHGDFWERSHHFLSHLGQINPASVLLGACALVVLILGKKILPNRPVALFVVIASLILASVVDLQQHGVKLLGPVPEGLPAIGLPAVRWSDLNDLLPLAFACFLLGAVETAAIGRMFTAKHGGRLNSNQEFLAIAAANLAAGLGRGFPVSGGMSQSLVNEGGGARTPLSGFIASLVVLVVVLFFSGMLQHLPQPVLAAIVLVAVGGLFKLDALKHLWRVDRPEFVAAMATVLGVLGSGLLRGVLIGAIISLIQLIHRAARPHVATLGMIPGTRRFSDLERHPDNKLIPGLLIVRPESGLIYFNVDHVRDTILDRARAAQPGIRMVLIDLSASPRVDLQSADTLASLVSELKKEGVETVIVEARASVRDRLRLAGVSDERYRIGRFTSVADVVDDFERHSPQENAAP